MTEIYGLFYGVLIGVCLFSGFLLGWSVYRGIDFIYTKLKKDYKHTLKSYTESGGLWEVGFCSKRKAVEALFDTVNKLTKILGPYAFKNIEGQVQCLGEGGHDLVLDRIETLYEASEKHPRILDVPFKSYKYKCGCGFKQSFRWEELSKTKQKAFEKIGRGKSMKEIV